MNESLTPQFNPIRARLQEAKAPALLVRQFEAAFQQLLSADALTLPEQQIEPITALPALDDWAAYTQAGQSLYGQTALIKLNGGLGTSMGLERAKSLLPAKNGLTFLDIIVRQVLRLRERTGASIPLILMNSFSTQSDSLSLLANYPELTAGQDDIPFDFLQNRVPKLLADTYAPAFSAERPALTWCPPGHGDIYVCLQTTGLLDQLRAKGYRYVFVSNADNLGAVADTRILGYMAEHQIPFVMEATRRTTADRKGGHLARAKTGGLLLRESAQCPPEDKDRFQDITHHRYFNTNNCWIDLDQLQAFLAPREGIMPLPVMVNRKTLDPRDDRSPAVLQLETAMGAALGAIPNATAVDVPRSRFAPVKTTNDLLALWSDYLAMDEDYQISPAPDRQHPNLDIQLDSTHYRLIDAFTARFPHGAPSLKNCALLRVEGDIEFGTQVQCHGTVHCQNPHHNRAGIADGAVLEGEVTVVD